MSRVFVLSCWSSFADHMNFGPRIFTSFALARQVVAGYEGSDRGWFEMSPGRALRWRDPKDHNRGFWEIETHEVEQTFERTP